MPNTESKQSIKPNLADSNQISKLTDNPGLEQRNSDRSPFQVQLLPSLVVIAAKPSERNPTIKGKTSINIEDGSKIPSVQTLNRLSSFYSGNLNSMNPSEKITPVMTPGQRTFKDPMHLQKSIFKRDLNSSLNEPRRVKLDQSLEVSPNQMGNSFRGELNPISSKAQKKLNSSVSYASKQEASNFLMKADRFKNSRNGTANLLDLLKKSDKESDYVPLISKSRTETERLAHRNEGPSQPQNRSKTMQSNEVRRFSRTLNPPGLDVIRELKSTAELDAHKDKRGKSEESSNKGLSQIVEHPNEEPIGLKKEFQDKENGISRSCSPFELDGSNQKRRERDIDSCFEGQDSKMDDMLSELDEMYEKINTTYFDKKERVEQSSEEDGSHELNQKSKQTVQKDSLATAKFNSKIDTDKNHSSVESEQRQNENFKRRKDSTNDPQEAGSKDFTFDGLLKKEFLNA